MGFLEINNNMLLGLLGLLFFGEAVFVFYIVKLFGKTSTIFERQATLFQGENAKNLEGIILKHTEDILAMDKDIQELFEISNRIHQLAFRSIHKVGVVRFNPFKEVGSNQSFVIALLDGKNSGTVLSSLHTRESSRIYAKPIENAESKLFPLTEEEKEAILLAQKVPSYPEK
jgi:hypothetical protein